MVSRLSPLGPGSGDSDDDTGLGVSVRDPETGHLYRFYKDMKQDEVFKAPSYLRNMLRET